MHSRHLHSLDYPGMPPRSPDQARTTQLARPYIRRSPRMLGVRSSVVDALRLDERIKLMTMTQPNTASAVQAKMVKRLHPSPSYVAGPGNMR